MLKQTVQKPIKPWKGSRFNNFKTSDQIRSQTSHHFHWVPGSIHSHTTRPRDAPPTRPSFPRHRSGSGRGQDVWWFCWCAGHRPRPGRDVSRGSSARLVAKQKPALKDWFEVKKRFVLALFWYQWSLIKKKLITNLKRLVLLGYLIRRTPCVQMCTNYLVHWAIHTKPSTHSITFLPSMKHDEIVAQHYMSKFSSLPPNRRQRIFWFSEKSKRTILIQPARPSH